MAKRGVIVRRLNAIENFGSMDVLCTDKTGTLTEGVVRLDGALDAEGQPSAAVLRCAYLNAHYQTGLNNPLDEAIGACAAEGRAGYRRRAEGRRDSLRLRAQAPERGRRRRAGRAHPDHQGRAGQRPAASAAACRTATTACPLDDARRAGIERAVQRLERPGLPRAGRGDQDRSTARAGSYSRDDESGPHLRRLPAVLRSAQGRCAARRSSTSRSAACSSRSSPATTRRWRGTSRRP